MPSEVRAAFEAFPEEVARLLLGVRATLFATAREAALVPCRTTLVGGFRADFPQAFVYGGSRAFDLAEGYDRAILAIFLDRALKYHRRKKEAGA